MTAARIRQWWADLRASFWLRLAAMTLVAVALAELLVRAEGAFDLPAWIGGWVYAGGTAGARDVLAVIAGATIAVAGTTFSITVAALTLASNQMGPRLLRNFTRDPGNQYALGALVATFAFALVALRSVHEAEEGAFVPQLAVSTALLLAFGCIGVLIWFLHHLASSINLDRVVSLVHEDLSGAIEALSRRDGPTEAGSGAGEVAVPAGAGGALRASGSGYLRVLDDEALADWAEEHGAVLRLGVRPGDFVFPGSVVGEVWPAVEQEGAQAALDHAVALGDARDVEQDLEFAVRQLVEIGLRALSPSLNDPFTAMAVLDRLAAALCGLARRALPTGCTARGGRPRVVRPAITYAGLVDTMFHMLRQAATAQPAVLIRMLEVLAEVGAVERDPDRCRELRRHADLARDAALTGTRDPSAREAILQRYARIPPAVPDPSRGLSPPAGHPACAKPEGLTLGIPGPCAPTMGGEPG